MLLVLCSPKTRHRLQSRSIFGMLLICCATNDTYAERHSLTETDFLSGLPVISRISGIEQPLNHNPASITIIDREMVGRRSAYEPIHSTVVWALSVSISTILDASKLSAVLMTHHSGDLLLNYRFGTAL